MNEIKLPNRLKGAWRNALIMTYGADVPFFENALWSQFGTCCRNKIILADGQRYLKGCAAYARSGLVRHLNQRYIADGILVSRAAHAKAILLTNTERGRLLVGSGNLSWQGYASGGEQFTSYEYTADDPEALNAFLAVRDIVDYLMKHHYIGKSAQRRVKHMWKKTPWLFQSPTSDWQPVRHNLNSTFIGQLAETVTDQPVEELWVLSPFYDEEAIALETLLATLRPRQVTLLVQPHHTSVDPIALERVLDKFDGDSLVCPFEKSECDSYVHAKLYLLKLRDQAICLQGSPNLSRAAMMLTPPRGNIEMANLLIGDREVFDGLLEVLDIGPDVTSLDLLDLSYRASETSTEPAQEGGWRLTSGEWLDDQLELFFHGVPPDLDEASLLIGRRSFPLDVLRQRAEVVVVRLSQEAAHLLKNPVPVSILWCKRDEPTESNPIFVCNRSALDAELEEASSRGTLDRIGDLDLDNEEFERLLGELEAALVIDRQSVWQIAGRSLPSDADADAENEALLLDYADVDYDTLRQHPKLQQYMSRGSGGGGYARTRLQIILSAITDHFKDLTGVSSRIRLLQSTFQRLEQEEVDTKNGLESRDERKQHSRSRSQRIGRILKNFIRRYLRGIRSEDFQEVAGFEVIAKNYVIFAHLLWRLFSKEWVEPEFIIDALLKIWSFMWGSSSQEGYLETLTREQRHQVLGWIEEHYADAELLAALYYAARLTRTERWDGRRFALRDFWREILLDLPFSVAAETIGESWLLVGDLLSDHPPLPIAIMQELSKLAEFETRQSFQLDLETKQGYPPRSCNFENVKVHRTGYADAMPVRCLVICSGEALSTKNEALDVLREWMRFEHLDYYRIACPDKNGASTIFFYEISEESGVYWARGRDQVPVDIDRPISASTAEWEQELSVLKMAAAGVDTTLDLVSREQRQITFRKQTSVSQGGYK
jgi:hypothetical protein